EALSTHLKLLKLTPFSELSFHSPKSSNLSFTGITIFLLQIWRRTVSTIWPGSYESSLNSPFPSDSSYRT
ncbi:hypothetical protein LINPERHAP1_LOCUS16012, partial [Linum perenne]